MPTIRTKSPHAHSDPRSAKPPESGSPRCGLFQPDQSYGARRRRYRRLDRHRAHGAQSELAGVFCRGGTGACCRRKRSRKEGLQVTHGGRQSDLSAAQMHDRAGVWHDQGSAGLPSVLAARSCQRARRMVSGLSGIQPAPHARFDPASVANRGVCLAGTHYRACRRANGAKTATISQSSNVLSLVSRAKPLKSRLLADFGTRKTLFDCLLSGHFRLATWILCRG